MEPNRKYIGLILFLLSNNVAEISCADNFFGTEPGIDEETDPLFSEMKAELAVQGPCWIYAIDRLESTRNNSMSQERLAFDFTNCFIEGVGLYGYYCRDSINLSDCTDFKKMNSGPHGNVYAIFYLQSQLLVTYLRELQRQRTASRQLETLKSETPLATKLSSISDTLLDSIRAQDEVLELKRLAVKSHEELRKNMGVTKKVLNDIYDTVTNYQIFGVTVVGAALYATNIFLRVVF